MWKEIITIVGGSSAAIAALSFLARAVVKLVLTKDIEAYKARLRAESDKQLEILKAELRMVAYEHEVTFRRLHHKRALVILGIYSRMEDADRAVASLVALFELVGEPDRKEKHKTAADKINEFGDYVRKNKIYLSESVCQGLDKLLTEFAARITKFQLDFGTDRYRETWFKSFAWFRDQVPPMRKSLEAEFRQLLGVQRGKDAPEALRGGSSHVPRQGNALQAQPNTQAEPEEGWRKG